MKRFVTYLYEYENGEKMKNVGFLRVDIRNQMVSVQISIRYPEMENEIGTLYIIVRDEENAYSIPLGELQMKKGQYQGSINCRYQTMGESPYSFEAAIGVGIRFENGCYLASSWKDDADEVIARGEFTEYGVNLLSDMSLNVEPVREETPIHDLTYEEKPPIYDLTYEEKTAQDTYRKINLNEIATLPSSNWYFSNNSFLIHGFWNYGYLVLKETMEEDKKKFALGVPGIFEQPEMVMATCFGFPIFETLPSQVVEMAIGETHQTDKKENQEPKEGIFGCWFVNL